MVKTVGLFLNATINQLAIGWFKMNEVCFSEKLDQISLIADEINDKAFLLQQLLGFISGCAD